MENYKKVVLVMMFIILLLVALTIVAYYRDVEIVTNISLSFIIACTTGVVIEVIHGAKERDSRNIIELKKELTSFIMNTSNQINDIIGNFIGNFEKNIVAFITFILGTIIANIVSDTPLNNIFTKDIITIIFVILLGSLFYLVITIIETYYRFLSYKKNYDDLKESYRDILDEQDIVTIFKNDKEYLKNKKNVKKITVIFSILWVTLVIIAFISMVLNYNSEYIKKVIDILYKIVKCI